MLISLSAARLLCSDEKSEIIDDQKINIVAPPDEYIEVTCIGDSSVEESGFELDSKPIILCFQLDEVYVVQWLKPEYQSFPAVRSWQVCQTKKCSFLIHKMEIIIVSVSQRYWKN